MIITLTLNPCLDKTLFVSGLVVGEVNRARLMKVDLGGKGINVSRALLGLGLTSLAMGIFGGVAGDFMRRGLVEMGIETDYVPAAGETRTNITIFDEVRGLQTKINEAGPRLGPEETEALLNKVRSRARASDTWVFCGNLPPGARPDLYAQLICIVKEQGGRAFLDTSGPPLRLGAEAGPYLIKPNAAEAGEVMGRELSSDEDMLEATDFFRGMGVEVVAISRGERGAVISTRQGVVQAIPPQVKVKTPVGAGDSLMAGLIWALEKGLGLADMARWGVAAGTAGAMGEGTGVCTKAAVERLLERVKVDWLSVEVLR